jgi:hypothetical protein
MENFLWEAGLSNLAELRELYNVKTTVRIITNPKHPIRRFCVDLNRTDGYAYRTRTPKPLFVRASESFGNLKMDPRRIEQTPQYIRSPWISINNEQYDFELCTIGREASNKRLCKETTCILEEI